MHTISETLQTSNRVVSAIAGMDAQITSRIASGQTTQDKADELCDTLDMDIVEYCKFQELKSLASQTGKLTLNEAQAIYAYLGESVETFNAQPIAVKCILTKIFEELLSVRIADARQAVQS